MSGALRVRLPVYMLLALGFLAGYLSMLFMLMWIAETMAAPRSWNLHILAGAVVMAALYVGFKALNSGPRPGQVLMRLVMADGLVLGFLVGFVLVVYVAFGDPGFLARQRAYQLALVPGAAMFPVVAWKEVQRVVDYFERKRRAGKNH